MNAARPVLRAASPRRPARRLGGLAAPWLLLALGFFPAIAETQEIQPLAMPAELIGQLTLPGRAETFIRPSGLFVDDLFQETLVADAGRNRIVIFDAGGGYRFEFTGRDIFSTPLDVVAEPAGTIVVLGSTPSGRRLFRFDFDGAYLAELRLERPEGADAFDPRGLDYSPDGSLVVTDRAGPWVCFYEMDGSLTRSFRLTDGRGRPLSSETVIGSAHVRGGHVFIPISSHGSVYVYDTSGAFVRAIGRKGSNVGELSFPVDVALTRAGVLLVLDKNRYNVGCFDVNGKFLGEFGGRGARPGTYYHPTLLAVDATDRIYIGQVFQNRVDICRLPERIGNRHEDRELELTSECIETHDAGLAGKPGDLIAEGGAVSQDNPLEEETFDTTSLMTLHGGK